jgi:Multicopper oxidase
MNRSTTQLFLLLSVSLAFLSRIVHSSYDETLRWEPACSESYYDYYATLYFCHGRDGKQDAYGYRTTADATCNSINDLSPIIRMQAGKNYQLKLVNKSPSQPANIHTHGLHIPGEGNTDNVRRLADPKGGIVYYNWTIPMDHLDGTHWYHSHAHGYSMKQAQGGATGMLFIDRDDDDGKPDWMRRERILHVLDTSDLPFIFTRIKANGRAKETIPLERNVWHLLRMNFVAFPVIPKELDFTTNCEVRTAAYDGVWRDTVPSNKVQHTYKVFHSNRVDFAIKCDSDGELHYTQISWLSRILRFIANIFGFSDAMFPPLVKFPVSDNSGTRAESRPQSWTPKRPAYLQDLRGESVAEDTYTVQVSTHEVNGVEYSGNTDAPLAHFEYGSLQQWTMINGPLLQHPIHVHLFHMQIVTPGGCGHIYEEGQWYDTIAPESSGCTVRFRMMDVAGRTVLHCHIPLHVEQGAIAYVYVDNGPTNPGDDDVEEYAAELCAGVP